MGKSMKAVFVFLLLIILTTGSGSLLAGKKRHKQADAALIKAFFTRLQSYIPTLETVSKPDSPPFFNAAVRTYILEIPQDTTLLSPSGQPISTVTFIQYSADFIAVTDDQARRKSEQTWIVLKDMNGERRLYRPDDPEKALGIAEESIGFNAVFFSKAWSEGMHKPLLRLDAYQNEMQNTTWRFQVDNAFRQYILSTYPTTPDGGVIIESILPFRCVSDERRYRDHIPLHDRMRKALAELAVNSLKQHDLFERAQAQGLYLISLGCGSGEDLQVFTEKLSGNEINVVSIGIDVSPELIADGGTKFPGFVFIQGDALAASKLIVQAKAGNPLPDSAPTLVIAGSLLVYSVLNGSYEALRVLHQLIQPGVTDMVLLGGISQLLVTPWIASNAGWSVETTMYIDDPIPGGKYYIPDSPMLTLVKQASDTRKACVRARSQRCSGNAENPVLDLSMDGEIITMLESFLEDGNAGDFKVIDISWGHVTSKQIEHLTNLLHLFPGVSEVIVSLFEPWLPYVGTSSLQSRCRFGVNVRGDSCHKPELPAFDTDDAQLLGQSTELSIGRMYLPVEVEPCSQKSLSIPKLSPDYRAYHEHLEKLLSQHNLKLKGAESDHYDLYHVVAIQLGITPETLRRSLSQYISLNKGKIQTMFPGLSGQQFQPFVSSVSDGAMDDMESIPVIATMIRRRLIVLMPDPSQKGEVMTTVYRPDGSVSNTVPATLSAEDIFVIFGGMKYWQYASLSQKTP